MNNESMNERSKKSLGYQVSQDAFDTLAINNAGDPFTEQKGYLVNTLAQEKELIEYYAYQILKINEPIWGYCASGSTESIMNALWMARKRFPEATIYASKDCHFSVPKIAEMLCINIVLIDTDPFDGRMDMKKLRDTIVDDDEGHGSTAIVLLTMGTTIRNAYDNLSEFYQTVVDDLTDVKFHVHIDGAFGGAIYPFFRSNWLLYPIDSFNLSFHKFLGCPFPCSLFITTKRVQNEIKGNGCFGKDMVCIPDKDYTVSCSRNGTAVLKMYEKIISNPTFYSTHINNVIRCFQNKRYLIQKINKLVEYNNSNELGLSVELLNLPCELEERLTKYGVNIRKNHSTGLFDTHIYLCAHVTAELIDEFVKDLIS